MAYWYRAYGLRIRSALPLPFDSLAAADVADAADATVRLGSVPSSLPDRLTRTVLWQARPGALLLHVEGVARYLITDGRDVRIEPLGNNPADAASFVAGMPLTVLLQQRGVATLHAAAVQSAGGAVLLLGRSGHGKSSLAAALVERGHALLADDVTGVVLNDGRATALPAFASLRLWTETLEKMRSSPAVRSRVRQGLEKYWVEASKACAQPLPVRAAIVLKPYHGRDIDMAPVPPNSTFWQLLEHTHRKRALKALGQRPAHFRVVAAMARQVPMLLARRPRHPFLLDELAERVEEHVAEIGTVSAAAPREAGVGARHTGPWGGELRQMGTRASGPHAGGTPALREREELAPRKKSPGVVWIAGFPKSGSTWLRAVLTNYLEDNGQPASINALVGAWHDRDAFDEYLGIDSSHMTEEETSRHLARFREALDGGLVAAPAGGRRSRCDEPTFVKTHDAYRLPDGVPRFPATAKVVYLVRNPLDVAVSYAHHLQWDIDRTIAWMDDWQARGSHNPRGIHGRLPEPMTTWSNHVSDWVQHAEVAIHVARYEDLLAHPHAGFGAIARFARLDVDDARLGRAIEHSAFHRLQAQEAKHGYFSKQPTAPSFFRSGTAGSWRSVLAPEQVRAIVDAHGPVMERFGYLQEARAFLDGAPAHRPV